NPVASRCTDLSKAQNGKRISKTVSRARGPLITLAQDLLDRSKTRNANAHTPMYLKPAVADRANSASCANPVTRPAMALYRSNPDERTLEPASKRSRSPRKNPQSIGPRGSGLSAATARLRQPADHRDRRLPTRFGARAGRPRGQS